MSLQLCRDCRSGNQDPQHFQKQIIASAIRWTPFGKVRWMSRGAVHGSGYSLIGRIDSMDLCVDANHITMESVYHPIVLDLTSPDNWAFQGFAHNGMGRGAAA